MTTTTLSTWGTGQGVHVSKKVMEEAQVSVGDTCEVRTAPGVITLDFTGGEHRAVRREPVTFDDLFGGWDGPREETPDPWSGMPARGAEKELWG